MPVISEAARQAVEKSLEGFRERQMLRDSLRAEARLMDRVYSARSRELARLETARAWLQERDIRFRESVSFGVTTLRLRSGFELNYRPDGQLDFRRRPTPRTAENP